MSNGNLGKDPRRHVGGVLEDLRTQVFLTALREMRRTPVLVTL